MSKIKLSRSLILKVSISAMFLGLGLITKLLFSIEIPLLGENGVRVGLTGVFTSFPAILFGPFFGGTVSALSDFLGWALKPTGAYMPWFTITAFIGGFSKGLIWMFLKHSNAKIIKRVFASVFAAILIFSLSNIILFNSDGISDFQFESGVKFSVNSENGKTETVISDASGVYTEKDGIYRLKIGTYDVKIINGGSVFEGKIKLARQKTEDSIYKLTFSDGNGNFVPGAWQNEAFTIDFDANSSVLEKDRSSFSYISKIIFSRATAAGDPESNLSSFITLLGLGLFVFSVCGFIIFFADILFNKKFFRQDEQNSSFLIMISLVTAGLITTTLNTELLKLFVYSSWQNIAFWLLWIPRAVEEVTVCMIQSYIVAFLYSIYQKNIKSKLKL